MIDPTLPAHRNRLSRSIEYWHREHDRYRKARRQTILQYAGIPTLVGGKGGESPEMWGNLIQLAGQAHVVTLAYGEPSYTCIANVPSADSVAPRCEAFLNRWSSLIDLGETARGAALDSFFSYGIIETDIGILPPAAQHATGLESGPMSTRISLDDFGFDGHAKEWNAVSYMYRIVDVPLSVAQSYTPFLAYNPDGTLALQPHTYYSRHEDARIHDSNNSGYMAQEMVRLVKVYFPGSNVTAWWPANDLQFHSVSGEPLLVSPYLGHHTGPYAILSHLDVPDNLIPTAQIEGGKNFYALFNELAEQTAHQARESKYNTAFEMGSEPDAESLRAAGDREDVAVSNINKIGGFTVPGPDQGLLNMMNISLALFKELSGNLDDTLGLSPTAGTATQSELIRSRTNARGAESRRRMDRVMVLTGRKLLHLALNHPTLRLPIRQRVPGVTAPVMRDLSWLPPLEMPRGKSADDYMLDLVPDSMAYRSKEQRLQQLQGSIARIAQVAQIVAAGIPLDMEKYVEIEASYNSLPELRDIAVGLLPAHGQAKRREAMSIRSPGTGEYTRTSRSERTPDGELNQMMTQRPVEDRPAGLSIG